MFTNTRPSADHISKIDNLYVYRIIDHGPFRNTPNSSCCLTSEVHGLLFVDVQNITASRLGCNYFIVLDPQGQLTFGVTWQLATLRPLELSLGPGMLSSSKLRTEPA